MPINEETRLEAGAGEATALEKILNTHIGNFIHLFLTLLAMIVVAAALIAVAMTVYRDFPRLWMSQDHYQVLHLILQQILLIAIAGELALLLVFHRTSAALEVVLFVIARRMVATDVTSLDLLLGSIALSGLLVVRFYYLPGRPK